jgi:predicted transcriptional regulator
MIEITDKNKFDAIVKDALAKSESFPRWQNAIKKAVLQIEENGEFMTYDEKENYLLIWSQGSNEIYSANGVCQCKAFEQGYPCYHRAAARLVRLYLELPETAAPELPKGKSRFAEQTAAPYLKPSTAGRPETVGAYRV